ncbi:MAG: uracil-xanthine permease [Lachnospiraceae bacterium]|nr:uracil-xanthine permease [Lachnospiraceae bacterium]
MGKNSEIGKEAVYDARTLGISKMLVLGLQHMFAMFGATVLVPAITGLEVSTTLLFAGLGTLLFHLISKRKVPAFLGSSFAYLAAYAAIAPNGEKELLPYACLGVFFSGFLYLILAGLIKAFGTTKVMRFFPPIVTGPIIIAIGLNLSQSAVDNCATNYLVAIIAIGIVIGCNIWGKGMVKIIPIILGVIGSYLSAVLISLLAGAMGFAQVAESFAVDFTPVKEAAWIGLPIYWDRTVFSIFQAPDYNLMITAILTIMPVALATMVEHIGDISAISSTVGANYIRDPGLQRTLTGDGLATMLASLFGAPANTTYGENTGVLTLTKVFDPAVIRLAAVFAILFSFCPKFSALISCLPQATMGGVSLVLYGMISAVGVRNIVETKINFTESRNVIIAALILVLSIGINYSSMGAIVIPLGSVTISLSGLAVGSLVGILMNALLPGKDYTFNEEKPDATGVNFKV